MAKKNSEKYKDPRKCPDLELWGQKVAFVSPLCPIADPGYAVPKACCAACWADRSALEWAARAAEGKRR